MLKLTRKEREWDSGRARSWERKEGRQGSLRKEVAINVDFSKRTNVTPWWMQPGQRRIIVPAWYERYCTAGARKLPYDAASTCIRYGSDATTVSMVRMVLYSRWTETTVPCSPYCTGIRYSSDTPTVKISYHQIHHGAITAEPNHQQLQNSNGTLTRMWGRQGGKNEAKKEEGRWGIWRIRATVQWVVQWVEFAEQTNSTRCLQNTLYVQAIPWLLKRSLL